ncbi:efflux RND transporter periplasmic adaptor subunit [Tistrella mobilis]|uniref:efflux RND transporter periplasmic adaptor subunit n=1 Tax=Tistrella mobilis TaxID=171437 RepID=UPI00355626A5
MRMERLLRSSAGLTLAMIVLAGCNETTPRAPTPLPRVAVVEVAPERLEVVEDLPGRVVALRVAEIRPQVSGIVQRRLFEQGADIRAGDPLFQINPAPFEADVGMAAAALRRAEVVATRARQQVRRLEPLHRADAISDQALDDAVAQRDQAVAEVAQARATLDRRRLDLAFTTVEAPIAGRIDQALVSEGALVSPTDATPMARIQQVDQVYVDLRQPARSQEALREALRRRTGPDGQSTNGPSTDGEGRDLPVRILRSDGTPYGSIGHILFSGITVDAGTGDMLLRVLVDNPSRELLPGMFVRARVPRAGYDDALMIPQQAVTRAGGVPQVWIVAADATVRPVPVTLGELVDHRYRVATGLEAGQRVVVEGVDRLAEGIGVEPQMWRPGADAG